MDLQPLIMSCSPVRCLWTHTGPKHSPQSLSLSEDLREVKWVGEDQSHPDHPERFDSWPQVLCREGLTGRCYWEVERRGGVDIGVTYRGITRRGGVMTASLEGTTSPGVFIVMMMVTLPGTTVVEQHPPPPLWLHQSRSVSGPACWLSVLLQSVPRCRRVLTHTDTHPHLQHHIHPGGPPPWVWGLWIPGSSVSLCGL